MKKLVHFLLPIQIIILLLAPRFGWSIHDAQGTRLAYRGTAFEDGAIHCVYQSQDNIIDISYSNLFSKDFTITVNETIEYNMKVKLDGASIVFGETILPGGSNDIVWKDTYGIMFWRCILTITMTLISMKLFRHAYDREDAGRKLLYAGAGGFYIIAILISLRVLF